ncbi:hypothetical protein [Bacteroides sp. 224]|uniref:hypothetical protein n=1 Tax=Bacteroides sp. 224 TaxID=2302936 RepID=UPI0013D0B61B|nr:hypothetical protein [Bacteroides sp. 224]NDV63995.1 hypothetical protein [Bacteroides sp. 224]
MAEFDFFLDRKMTGWRRDSFTIEAETKEEALKIVREAFQTGEGENLVNSNCFDSSHLDETEEYFTIEQNNGLSTEAVFFDETGEEVYQNGKSII